MRAIFGISGKHYVLDTTLGENGKQEIILPEAPRMVLTGEWMYETVTDYNGQFFIPMIVLGTQDYPYFRTLSYKGTA